MARIVKILQQQPFAQAVNELANILTPKILAERDNVSEMTVSLLRNRKRGAKHLRPGNSKNLSPTGNRVAKRKQGPRFDVEKLKQAIVEQLPPERPKGRQGPMKLNYHPKTKFGKDFAWIFKQMGLSQKDFATTYGVSLAFVQNALSGNIE